MSKCCVEPDGRIHHSKAIGANQPHRTTAQLRLNQALKLHAFRATLLETSGNHDGRACARSHTFANHAGHRDRRRCNNSEVDRLRQRRHGRIALNSQQFGMLGIHGKYLPAIGAVNKILENRPAHTPFAFRGADYGNGRRCEETFKSGACTTQRTGHHGRRHNYPHPTRFFLYAYSASDYTN